MTADESASSAKAREQPERTEAGGEPPIGTLADKINHLFATVKKADGSRFTNDEVAATMREHLTRLGGNSADGPRISGAYLSALRKGARTNPTKSILEALAAFFQQSPAYFFPDAKSKAIAEELQLLQLLADAGVKRVAMRLGGLSDDSLRDIGALVERVRALEGLDARRAGDQHAE
jgi:transcriptional regulator with XRE-family HTH domain